MQNNCQALHLVLVFSVLACCLAHTFVFATENAAGMVINHEDFPLSADLVVEYSVKSTLEQMDNTTMKHEYLSETEIQDTLFVKRVTTMSGEVSQTAYFYRSDEGIMRVPAISSSEKSLVLKIPLRIGESWEQEDFIGTRSIKTIKRAETIETVETPLGKLRCIKVRHRKPGATDTDEDSFIWVAKRYGIVKIEINKRTSGNQITRTVITISAFHDKKGPEDNNGG